MSLKIGIVGLPNVGKSTLFQAITKKQVDCSNYPFCTIEPNIGVVAVPDSRVDKLAELTHSAKKIYATCKFVDVAGLVKGAHKGEGLGNQFLAHIREVDAIIYVLRCFQNEKIINTQGQIDVLNDKEILDTEMVLKDLSVAEKSIEGLEKDARQGDKDIIFELDVLRNVHGLLQKGKLLLSQEWSDTEKKILNNYQFLTLKPRLYLLNCAESEISPDVLKTFQKNSRKFLVIDLLTELEALDIEPEERPSFGLPTRLKLDSLIKESYKLLGLITFFTIKSDETHAWNITEGTKVPQAGGVIHSDFENYFIKAEVIKWQELISAGGFANAKERGLVRTEGKDYVVKDGDVIEIKSGV